MSFQAYNAEIGNDSLLPYPYLLAIYDILPVSFNTKEINNKLPRVATITVNNYTHLGRRLDNY
jgi:hypothetical protein